MRPFVKTVYSNLKSPRDGGEPWEIELGQHTLLVGTNTSHKSSIIQSVELSVAGSADDIFGRNAVSDAALLLTLAPGDELGISTQLSDGNTTSFHVCRDGGTVKRPKHTGPGANTLVHRVVASALSGSPASARKAFLAWSGDGITLDAIVANLPTDLHEKYREVAGNKGRNRTAVETLIEVAAYAGQRQREAAKESKGAEFILESIGDTVDSRPSAADRDKLSFDVAEARKVLDLSIRSVGSMSVDERAAKLIELKDKQAYFQNQTRLSQDSYNQMKAQLPKKGENVEHAIKIIDVAIKHHLDACPVCSSHVGAEHLKNCQTFYAQQQTDWNNQSADGVKKLAGIQSQIDTYKQHTTEFGAKVRQLEGVPLLKLDSQILPVAEAQAKLETVMSALNKLENTQAQWETLANARNRAMTMKDEVESYKTLKLSCESAVGVLLGERAQDFSDRVQKYLPSDWTFKIELMDGNKAVFRMGIFRNGKLHAALSGAEWTSIVTSIAMAVSEGLPETAPAILIPEDRAWDGKTLGAVMRSFSNFDGQVIMASTIRPMGRPPKGWTVIDMDKTSESWCAVDSVDEEELPVEEVEVSKTSINHATGGFRVTSRSSLILEDSGFTPDDIQMMSRDTYAYPHQ
mgnify:FL=1